MTSILPLKLFIQSSSLVFFLCKRATSFIEVPISYLHPFPYSTNNDVLVIDTISSAKEFAEFAQ